MTGTAEAAPTPRAAQPRRLPAIRLNERVFYGLLGFVGILLAWQLAADAGIIKKILMSSPTAIADAFVADLANGTLVPQIWVSLSEWIIGFGVSVIVGVPFGLLIGWFRRLGYLTNALIAAVYATPLVAIYPLIVLIVGLDLSAKIVVIFLIAVFSIIINTTQGVQAIDRRHMEIARSFGASQSLIVRSVLIPTTIPFVLTGLRIGSSRALVGVIIAEFMTSNAGVAFYISMNGQTLNTARVFVGLLLFGLFGVATGEVVRLIEHRFDVWRPAIN